MHRRSLSLGRAAGRAVGALGALMAMAVVPHAAAVAAPTGALVLDVSSGDPVDSNGSGDLDAGDTIAYTYRATNTGTSTVSGVSIVGRLTDDAQCPAYTDLAAAAVLECHETYRITQRDLDAGTVDNVAAAEGLGTDGSTVVSPSDRTSTPLEAVASVTITKRAAPPKDTNGSDRIDAGDLDVFEYDVTNTGDLTLHGLAVTDPAVDNPRCPVAELAPATTTVCTALHRLTQQEVDARAMSTAATVTALSPHLSRVTATAARMVTALPGQPAVTLTLGHAFVYDPDGDLRADVGDQIVYTFKAYNSGTTTLSDITIGDPLLRAAGDPIKCPDRELGSGETLTCTAVHTVTRDDVTGRFVNTANVRTGGVALVTSPFASLDIPTDPNGDLGVHPRSWRPWWLAGGAAVLLAAATLLLVRVRGRRRGSASASL